MISESRFFKATPRLKRTAIAMRRSGEFVVDTAEALGVSLSVLTRWYSEDDKLTPKVPRKGAHKCNICGHTFLNSEIAATHRIAPTDGRVKLTQHPVDGQIVSPRWMMQHNGRGGNGWVVTAPLRKRCMTEQEMLAAGMEWYGGMLGPSHEALKSAS